MVKLPARTRGYKSRVINEIIDYIRAITVKTGRGLIESDTLNGKLIEAKTGVDAVERRKRGDVVVIGTSTVWVYELTDKRNGPEIVLTCDVGKGYKSLTGLNAASTTYYIYVEREAATTDPQLQPDTLTAKSTTTNPAETFGNNAKVLLVTVTTDASGYLKQPVIKHQGDLDDQHIIPDANSAYDAAGAGNKRFLSTEFSPRVGRHAKNLQDYNWDTAASTAITESDWLMFRQVVAAQGGDEAYYVKRYILKSAFKATDSSHADDADHADEADGITDISTWPGHPHALHTDYASDDHTGQDGDADRYLRVDAAGGTAARNNMGGVIGDAAATPKTSIEPNARLLRNEAGNVTVLNWNSTSWELTFGATNKWTAATFLVGVTGAINFTSGAVSTWTIKGLNLFPVTDTVDYLEIGSEDKRWNSIYAYVSTGFFVDSESEAEIKSPSVNLRSRDGSGSLYLGGSSGAAEKWTNIYFNQVAGVDITGWTTKGGVTGTGIIEIGAADLLPTDKILVRR